MARTIEPNLEAKPKRSARLRRTVNVTFLGVCILTSVTTVAILLVLLGSIIAEGWHVLGWEFITNPPAGSAPESGIGPALQGTVWVCLICAAVALPLGVSTAIFLEEFQPTHRWLQHFHGFVQVNIANLAGVPSIVYGLLGLTVFATMFGKFGNANDPALEWGAEHVRQYITEGNNVVFIPVSGRKEVPELRDGMMAEDGNGEPVRLNIIEEGDPYPESAEVLGRTLYRGDEGGHVGRKHWYYFRIPFGRSVLTAGLTLMLVILPVIIIASQESLRAVPSSLREGALGLGATRWQVIRNVTLPAAMPGIMTGSILSTSRAIGEAAPIVILAGQIYMKSGPSHLMDHYSVLPLQIFYWAAQPIKQEAEVNFQHIAAAGSIVLLMILLSFNAIAITIRQFMQKPLS